MLFASDSNNSYPLFYQQSPLSCTNAILDYNNKNTLFHHHHHLHHYPSSSENPNVKLPLSEPSSINQENTNIINNNYYPAYSNNVTNNPMPETRRVSTTTTTTGKKDRHTKICTAQGIRDRRVRLSMSIAREFFNLQDMLGFDKASETLGWLLAKSKAAIDELASNNSNNNNNGTTTSIEDLNEEDGDNEFFDDDEKGGLNSERSSSKKRKRQELNRLKEQHLVEEVRREKARERARERTRMKKTIVVADDDHNNNNHHRHQQQQQQYQIERFDYHQQQQQQQIHHQRVHQQDYNSIPSISKGVSVGETIVINKDNNRSRSSFNYNYEMMSSKDDDNQEGGIHYNSDCFNKFASENCNYNGIMQQPASLFPALNIINLSTEIHINARPWDTYSNQILH